MAIAFQDLPVGKNTHNCSEINVTQ